MILDQETWWWSSLAHLLVRTVVKLNNNGDPSSHFHTRVCWLSITSQSSWVSSLEGAVGKTSVNCFMGPAADYWHFSEAITRQSIPEGCFANWQQSQELELLREIRGHYSVGQMWPGSSVLFQVLISRPALPFILLRYVFNECFLSDGNGNVLQGLQTKLSISSSCLPLIYVRDREMGNTGHLTARSL